MSCNPDVTGKLQWKKINSDGIVEEAISEKTFFLRDCPVGAADVFRPEVQESIKIITEGIDDGFLVEIKNDGEQNVLYFENTTLIPFPANATIKLYFSKKENKDEDKGDAPLSKKWSKLLGTSSDDLAYGVSVDSSGNVYMTGGYRGTLDDGFFSNYETFLVRYNSSGNEQWRWTLGKNIGAGVSVDSAGNVYVTGAKEDVGEDDEDVVLYKINSSGDYQWERVIGTNSWDYGTGVSVDSAGNVYVAGYSGGDFDGHINSGGYDMFLIKYDSSGNKKWSKLLGSDKDDSAQGVSVDSAGNVYVTGSSQGDFDGHTNLGEYDVFLVKYDSSGNKKWSRLLGTSNNDWGNDVSVDSAGNVYVTGQFGHTKQTGGNMFLTKYDSSGNKKWAKLLGSDNNDWGESVSVDSSGNVYVIGSSWGNFDGHANSGERDMFLVKYDSSGNKKWSKLFGSSSDDDANGVSVDSAGNIYVTGSSKGNFDGHASSGSWDMFLVKFGQ